MDSEEPPLPPNPELLNRQPNWFKPVFRSCVILSVASAFLLLSMFWPRMRGHHQNVDLTEAHNNVRTYDIHKDGHVYDKGINLLSPKHPVWKGKPPDIRYPE
jgi:hypothetical protein